MNNGSVLCVADLAPGELEGLLEPYGIVTQTRTDGPIPGSYWGDNEAGLTGNCLQLRPDTPVHSALHEACHFICMSPDRRAGLHTDAGGDDLEECAVCYLQILIGRQLPDFSDERQFADMDAWGYSFRLGSSRAWFNNDASDARRWLRDHQLIDAAECPTGQLRSDGPQST